jgi:hypothetical protein
MEFKFWNRNHFVFSIPLFNPMVLQSTMSTATLTLIKPPQLITHRTHSNHQIKPLSPYYEFTFILTKASLALHKKNHPVKQSYTHFKYIHAHMRSYRSTKINTHTHTLIHWWEYWSRHQNVMKFNEMEEFWRRFQWNWDFLKKFEVWRFHFQISGGFCSEIWGFCKDYEAFRRHFQRSGGFCLEMLGFFKDFNYFWRLFQRN